MTHLHRAFLFLGTFSSLVLSAAVSHGQSCANSDQVPLTKVKLEEIASAVGIGTNDVELRFEDFALETVRPGLPIPHNNRFFFSADRRAKAGIANVVPDGVIPLITITAIPLKTFIHSNSVFYESKAVRRTRLPPSYQKYQILGFLDALEHSPAGSEGSFVPAIVFMTTSDVKAISKKTRLLATVQGVGILHTIACEIPDVLPTENNLQMGAAIVVNPEVYILNISFPFPSPPGSPGRVRP
ncbi:hypothetical protein C7B65_01280 [Phormidesmis priestleyi ULC007]|uniref:Uncharacterized protein n=1 Tax=Phormidesmis priestleyi ULC007 TaxID=1920490 RepID=A0A2T1DNJ8_9CYAN|nr:hypothetical protein [Phormidesmis priestleyi]PSB22073.1 hypothetical protein C7B65_01280 [Phormidesmis priestleyi ULC007]PZO54959.1 MAG: hypothetical protein DCF14_00295 [Phormidesmis priestleyi]